MIQVQEGARCPVCNWEYTGPLPGTCPRPSCGVELVMGEDGKLRIASFLLDSHYSYLILPFAFPNLEARALEEKIAQTGRYVPRVFSPTSSEDIDRTEYFLPYIRRFLFPTLFKSMTTTKAGKEKRTSWHYTFDLERFGPTGRHRVNFHLKGYDVRKKEAYDFPLTLDNLELLVFSYRVGFLIMRIRCHGDGCTFFEQMESLTYLRMIAPLYQGFEMPSLVVGSLSFRLTQLLVYLLAEFGEQPSWESPASVPLSACLPVQPIYDDRLMVYTFSCLEKTSAVRDGVKGSALLDRLAIVHFDPSETSRGKYEGNEPDAWLYTRWQGFSKDGTTLVAFNSDRYHEKFLGIYHGTYYFDIFLLAALQRMILLTLFESFSDIQRLITGDAPSRKLLRKVRRDLLLFKNQCWFSQITNRDKGQSLWKKWQRIFENRTLLKEVNEQSLELDTYLQQRYRERIEILVRLGSFLAAVLPTSIGLERILGSQSPWIAQLRWALLGVLAVASVVAAYFIWFRRNPDDD